MAKILVLYPNSSYEEEWEAKNILEVKRKIIKKTGKSAPSGTKYRYACLNEYFSERDKTFQNKVTKESLVKQFPKVFK